MNPFTYARAADAADAHPRSAAPPARSILGGGTNLVDLMRESVERPAALVDVTGSRPRDRGARGRRPADRRGDQQHRAGRASRGARRAIRCWRARSSPAPRRRSATWRRSAATSCSARAAPTSTTTPRAATSASPARAATRSTASTASTRSSAPRRACVATHPSDMCVALAALDADRASARAPDGARTLPLDRRCIACRATRPTSRPSCEPGELITAVELPPLPFGARSTYRKVRDRASYAFALVSVAAALEVDGRHGQATCGWRSAASRTSRGARSQAEAALRGQPADGGGVSRRCRGRAGRGARRCATTRFKVELAKRTIVAVLDAACGRPRMSIVQDACARCCAMCPMPWCPAR